MQNLVKVFKALADTNRLRILKMLEKKKMCVCELSAALKITQPSVSKHLGILKNAGLVRDEKNGQWTDHALCTENRSPYVSVLLGQLKEWINESDTVVEDRKNTEIISRYNLCMRTKTLSDSNSKENFHELERRV